MEALADRIIPPDPQTPGGKDSGSAVFVDRQLAGGYGAQEGLYVRPPFITGSEEARVRSPKADRARNTATGWPRSTAPARPGRAESVSPILRTTGRIRS